MSCFSPMPGEQAHAGGCQRLASILLGDGSLSDDKTISYTNPMQRPQNDTFLGATHGIGNYA